MQADSCTAGKEYFWCLELLFVALRQVESRLTNPRLVEDAHGRTSGRLKIAGCSIEFYETHLRKLGFTFLDETATLETDASTYNNAREAISRLGLHFPAGKRKKEKQQQPTHFPKSELRPSLLPTAAPLTESRKDEKRTEALLRAFLRRDNNIRLLERGLRLVGDEFRLKSGRADIMAVDDNEDLVVVELKFKRETGDALVQILDYMHSTMKQLSSTPPLGKTRLRKVRGIIVAPSFSERLQRVVKDMATMKERPYRIILRHCVARGGTFEFPV